MGKIFGKRGTSSGSASGAVALAAGIALLLAGCGGDAPEETSTDDNRDVEQSAPAPESDAPSPSASPPGLPESTAMPTSKAAVRQQLHDATVHLWEVIDKAYQTNDATQLEKLWDPNTTSQSGPLREIQRAKEAGERSAKSYNYRVEDFRIKRHGDDKTVDAFFTLSYGAGSEVNEDGTEVRSSKPGSAQTKVTFVREGNQWLVQRIEHG